MVCYSDKCKAVCAKVIMVVSIILVILGIVTAIFGAMQDKSVQDKLNLGPDFSLPSINNQMLSLGVTILGVIAIVVGILGLLVARFKNCCVTVPFMLLSLIIGLVLLIFGIFVIGAANNLSLIQSGIS